MSNEEQQQELYTYRFEDDEVQLPIPYEQWEQLDRTQQIIAYDTAMAEQIEWTDENITTHPDWINAARELYPHFVPESTAAFQSTYDYRVTNDPWRGGVSPAEASAARRRMRVNKPVQEMSDEELGDWLYDHIGELNGNLSALATTASDLSDSPELARHMNVALSRYQNKRISFRGAGNVFEGVLQDPLTYAGIGTAVRGTAGLIGKNAAAGTVRTQLVRAFASGTAVGAAEGAVYAAADDIARQSIENTAFDDDEYDLRQTAIAATFGAVIGGGLGFALGDAIGLARRGSQKLADDAARQADNVTVTLGDDLAEPSVPERQVIVNYVEGIDQYNDVIPQNTYGNDGNFFSRPVDPNAPPRLDTDALGAELRAIEDAVDDPALGFFENNAQKATVMARRLRRLFLEADPEERAEIRDVILGDQSNTSANTRGPALEILIDDSAARKEDLIDQYRVEAARETPDAVLLDTFEQRIAQEDERLAYFEALSTEYGRGSGQGLAARQGATPERLELLDMSTEEFVRQRAERARVAALEAAERGEDLLPAETPPVREGFWSKAVGTLVELQRNSLLSAPKTIVANVVGPIINATTEWIEESLGAVGTRFASDVHEEGAERLLGMTYQMAESLRIGRMAMDEHRIVTGTDFIDGEEAVTRAISSENYGLDKNSAFGRLVDGTGATVRVVDAIQLFSDSFITSRLAVAESFSQARIAGRKKGLSGAELDRYVESRVADTFDPNTGAIRDTSLLQEVERIIARQRADRTQHATMTDKAISWGEDLYRSHPWTRLLQPFWRTPLRLLQQGVRRLPILQQFSTSFRRDLSGQNGYRAYVRARGQFMFAQAIGSFAVLATMNQWINGEPHSMRDFRIAGEGEDLNSRDSLGVFNYANLDPVAMPIRVISRITDEMMYAIHLGDEERFDNLGEQMTSAFMGLLSVVSAGTIEQTMLQGLEDTVEALQIATNPDEQDPGQAISRWTSQRLGTFWPNFLKKVDDFNDPNREQGTGPVSHMIAATNLQSTLEGLDALLAEYTGSDTSFGDNPYVMTRRNMLGEPIEVDAVLSTFGIVAANEKEGTDPVREELQEVMVTSGRYFGNMRFRRAEANDMDLRRQLTDSGDMTIYEAWQANMAVPVGDSGESYIRQRLQALFETDAYKNGSVGRRGRPGLRDRLIAEAFTDARDIAWRRTIQENPEFFREYTQAQTDELIRSFQ